MLLKTIYWGNLLFLPWLLGCFTTKAVSMYVEPEWWPILEATFDGVNLQRCRKRNGAKKWLGPPPEGTPCDRTPKTCFFGGQDCPGGYAYPSIRCQCDGAWHCGPAYCPGEPIPVPTDTPPPSSTPTLTFIQPTGCLPYASIPPSAEASLGSISGSLIGVEDDDFLLGKVPITLLDCDGIEFQSTLTDSDGHYVLNHVPVGHYTVKKTRIAPDLIDIGDSDFGDANSITVTIAGPEELNATERNFYFSKKCVEETFEFTSYLKKYHEPPEADPEADSTVVHQRFVISVICSCSGNIAVGETFNHTTVFKDDDIIDSVSTSIAFRVNEKVDKDNKIVDGVFTNGAGNGTSIENLQVVWEGAALGKYEGGWTIAIGKATTTGGNRDIEIAAPDGEVVVTATIANPEGLIETPFVANLTDGEIVWTYENSELFYCDGNPPIHPRRGGGPYGKFDEFYDNHLGELYPEYDAVPS